MASRREYVERKTDDSCEGKRPRERPRKDGRTVLRDYQKTSEWTGKKAS